MSVYWKLAIPFGILAVVLLIIGIRSIGKEGKEKVVKKVQLTLGVLFGIASIVLGGVATTVPSKSTHVSVSEKQEFSTEKRKSSEEEQKSLAEERKTPEEKLDDLFVSIKTVGTTKPNSDISSCSVI